MLLVLSLLVVLATSFFCSLSEASLLSASRVRVLTLADSNPAAAILARLKQNLDRPIAAILILNTVANTGGAALAGREYERVFNGVGIGLFTIGFTLAVLVISELLPKTLGVRYSMRSALWLARPLWILTRVMRPLIAMVEMMTRLLGSKHDKHPKFSLEDLRTMAQLAVASESLRREEQMIIDAAARLPRITVQQIMIHRQDILFLSMANDDETNLVRARRSMHSRLPLCHNDLDDVVGIVNVKEVLWRLVEEPEDHEELGLKRILGEAVREPISVQPDLEATGLLNLFSREHEHLAMVRDENGVLIGMVTLEDVIEEIIGEVDDEYDRSPRGSERLGPDRWQFGGGCLWTDVAQKLGLPGDEFLPEDIDLDGRLDLNDFAADRLRGKLRTGGVFLVSKWRFKVKRMRRGKVLYVEALLLGAGSADLGKAPPKPRSKSVA